MSNNPWIFIRFLMVLLFLGGIGCTSLQQISDKISTRETPKPEEPRRENDSQTQTEASSRNNPNKNFNYKQAAVLDFRGDKYRNFFKSWYQGQQSDFWKKQFPGKPNIGVDWLKLQVKRYLDFYKSNGGPKAHNPLPNGKTSNLTFHMAPPSKFRMVKAPANAPQHMWDAAAAAAWITRDEALAKKAKAGLLAQVRASRTKFGNRKTWPFINIDRDGGQNGQYLWNLRPWFYSHLLGMKVIMSYDFLWEYCNTQERKEIETWIWNVCQFAYHGMVERFMKSYSGDQAWQKDIFAIKHGVLVNEYFGTRHLDDKYKVSHGNYIFGDARLYAEEVIISGALLLQNRRTIGHKDVNKAADPINRPFANKQAFEAELEKMIRQGEEFCRGFMNYYFFPDPLNGQVYYTPAYWARLVKQTRSIGTGKEDAGYAYSWNHLSTFARINHRFLLSRRKVDLLAEPLRGKKNFCHTWENGKVHSFKDILNTMYKVKYQSSGAPNFYGTRLKSQRKASFRIDGKGTTNGPDRQIANDAQASLVFWQYYQAKDKSMRLEIDKNINRAYPGALKWERPGKVEEASDGGFLRFNSWTYGIYPYSAMWGAAYAGKINFY